MQQVKIRCPYCLQLTQLKILKCCFAILCQKCYDRIKYSNNHTCSSSPQFFNLFPSNNEYKFKQQLCVRCKIQMANRSCENCNHKNFCDSCFNEIHSKQKFLNHKSLEIISVPQNVKQLECELHNNPRNVILQDSSFGCIKCADQQKVKKLNISSSNKENNDIVFRQNRIKDIIQIKLIELENMKIQAENRWVTLNKQIQQQFMLIKKQIQRKEKQYENNLILIKNEQLKELSEITKSYTLIKQTIQIFQLLAQSNSIVKQMQKIKMNSINQELKNLNNRKFNLGSYQYKKTKNNLHSILIEIKNFGNIQKVKTTIVEDVNPIFRNSLRNNSMLVNTPDISNRKRSQSKDNSQNRCILRDSSRKIIEKSDSITKFDTTDCRYSTKYRNENKLSLAIKQKLSKKLEFQIGKQYLVMTQSSTEILSKQKGNIHTQKKGSSIQFNPMNPQYKIKNNQSDILQLRESVKRNTGCRQSLTKR